MSKFSFTDGVGAEFGRPSGVERDSFFVSLGSCFVERRSLEEFWILLFSF